MYNTVVEQVKKGETLNKRLVKAGEWRFDEQGLLRCNQRVYVPNQAAVIQELLKRYYNDPLAGHFEVNKIMELLNRKFY